MENIMVDQMCKCFKCQKDITSAISDTSPWDAPNGGVVLSGGNNYGSTLYDSLVDGISIEVVICDECLKIAKENNNGSLKEKTR
jgi:hypothetical protein